MELHDQLALQLGKQVRKPSSEQEIVKSFVANSRRQFGAQAACRNLSDQSRS